MARDMTAKKYRIREVRVRLAEGRPLYSEQAMQTPQDAVEVMKRELSRYDREVLVMVNLNSGFKPLNFNIVSIGDLTQAIASIPNLLVSGILSNAASFLVLHNHPSGELTPSQEDIAMTKRVIEAGQLVGIPCVDHIIVASGESGLHRSMREADDVEFDRSFYRTETGKEQVGEMKEEYRAEKTAEVEELSIKFGKGLWAKLPADGHVTVSKSVVAGVENGKTVWNNEKRSVPVPELKSMVEFYKTKDRASVVDQLGDMKKTAGEKVSAVKPRKKLAEIAK